MHPLSDVALFALTSLVLVLTPGPNMIYCVSRALSQGRAAGLLSLAGVLLGFVAVGGHLHRSCPWPGKRKRRLVVSGRRTPACCATLHRWGSLCSPPAYEARCKR
jgi:hypothetical protein